MNKLFNNMSELFTKKLILNDREKYVVDIAESIIHLSSTKISERSNATEKLYVLENEEKNILIVFHESSKFLSISVPQSIREIYVSGKIADHLTKQIVEENEKRFIESYEKYQEKSMSNLLQLHSIIVKHEEPEITQELPSLTELIKPLKLKTKSSEEQFNFSNSEIQNIAYNYGNIRNN